MTTVIRSMAAKMAAMVGSASTRPRLRRQGVQLAFEFLEPDAPSPAPLALPNEHGVFTGPFEGLRLVLPKRDTISIYLVRDDEGWRFAETFHLTRTCETVSTYLPSLSGPVFQKRVEAVRCAADTIRSRLDAFWKLTPAMRKTIETACLDLANNPHGAPGWEAFTEDRTDSEGRKQGLKGPKKGKHGNDD